MKSDLGGDFFDDGGALVARHVLKILDLRHGRLVLRLAVNGLFRLDVQLARSDGLAERVGGAARVETAVLRVRVHDVQRHEAEAVGLGETRAGLERYVVAEPLHLERRVGDGD